MKFSKNSILESARNFLIVFFIILQFGCVTQPDYQAYYASFKGHTKQEIIIAIGPPTRVESDGAGGSVMIYEKGGAVNIPAGGVWVTRTFVDYTQVYCDRKDIVYYVRYGRK
jgi:hypothetical protein